MEKEKNNKKHKKIILFSLCIVITLLVIIPVSTMLNQDESVKFVKKDFTINELRKMESSTFLPLNEINFPSSEFISTHIDDEFVEAINQFAYKIYDNIDDKNQISFSPMSLYSILFTISLASSDEKVLNEFDNVLGLSSQVRKENFIKMYENNYFANDYGTTQTYNSIFINNNRPINDEFVKTLKDYFIEAFSLNLNLSSDLNNMLKWVDQRTNSKDFINIDDLQIDDESAVLFFSTLYFNNKWSSCFLKENNTNDLFYNKNKTTSMVEYMNHSYFTKVYEYDKYISVYDHYFNGYKVKYVVPNDINDDIFELTKDVNILIENEEALVDQCCAVNLSLPKFETSKLLDFSKPLKKIGLNSIFDKNYNSLNNIYKDDTYTYINDVKQKSYISFSEDGTISLSFSLAKAGSAAKPDGIYEVKLNQPFIYVIYDKTNIPIYLGTICNL